jgi:ABC-2 type transport system permease protein
MTEPGSIVGARADRLACATLWRREMVRFVRQRSRIIGAFGTPLVFWILAGAGLGRSMRLPGSESMSYFQYSFPGALASILMFTAIFSTISIIDDRREGFMQGVLVAPVSRMAIVLGKVLGGVTLAVGQAVIFLIFAPLAGISLHLPGVLAGILVMTLIAFSTTSLGMWIAWKMESTQGFHAIMNLFLMPMLLLSGAFFPAQGSMKAMQIVISCNPMTYGVCLLRRALNMGTGIAMPAGPGWALSLGISLLFSAIMFGLLARSVTKDSAAALH